MNGMGPMPWWFPLGAILALVFAFACFGVPA